MISVREALWKAHVHICSVCGKATQLQVSVAEGKGNKSDPASCGLSLSLR